MLTNSIQLSSPLLPLSLPDLVNEELFPNLLRDELTHMAAELTLGRGSPTRRLVTWGQKFMKYRLKQPQKSELTTSMLALVPVDTARTLDLVPAPKRVKRQKKT